MPRPKTISDEAVLAAARKCFRAHGYATSTRQIAEEAGISEGVLYQRFKTKEDLFFASMVPTEPAIEELFGPEEPRGEALPWLKSVATGLARHFAEVVPLAIRLITHPGFDHGALARAHMSHEWLEAALVRRLTAFAKRDEIQRSAVKATARLVVSVTHDWALARAMAGGTPGANAVAELEPMVDVIWKGARKVR